MVYVNDKSPPSWAAKQNSGYHLLWIIIRERDRKCAEKIADSIISSRCASKVETTLWTNGNRSNGTIHIMVLDKV